MSRKRASGCVTGKVRYRDHDEATRSLHTITVRSSRTKKAVRAYQCPMCRGWHLTSQAERS